MMLNAFLIVCIGITIIIPGIYQISNYLNGTETKPNQLVLNIIFTLSACASITLANILVFRFFTNRYKNIKHYARIFFYEFLISTINAIVIMALIVYVFYIANKGLPDGEDSIGAILFENIVVAVIVNTIVCGFAETYILFKHWKKTIIESERLRREKAESQYLALKNQVNPHFLFNSLNSLSSLIRISPDKAIEFVDKFSKIYRYVLDSTDKMLIELREEINFLQSYIYLQKIRFGDNLEINLNIDARHLDEYIPPLAIQMLVENALKHNEVSTEFPLKINLEIEDNYLIISNNLQLKHGIEDSTGIGLKNLEARYELFTEQKPIFYATTDKYFAKIPLIKDTE